MTDSDRMSTKDGRSGAQVRGSPFNLERQCLRLFEMACKFLHVYRTRTLKKSARCERMKITRTASIDRTSSSSDKHMMLSIISGASLRSIDGRDNALGCEQAQNVASLN